jgi:hypothetical protein
MYSPELYYEIAKIYVNERIDDAHKRHLVRAKKYQEKTYRDVLQHSLNRIGRLLEPLGRDIQGGHKKGGRGMGPRGTSYG